MRKTDLKIRKTTAEPTIVLQYHFYGAMAKEVAQNADHNGRIFTAAFTMVNGFAPKTVMSGWENSAQEKEKCEQEGGEYNPPYCIRLTSPLGPFKNSLNKFYKERALSEDVETLQHQVLGAVWELAGAKLRPSIPVISRKGSPLSDGQRELWDTIDQPQ